VFSDVLSSCSNFPSRADRDKIDELLPDISEVRKKLTNQEAKTLDAVLNRNAAVLARNKTDIGCTEVIEQPKEIREVA
jgi:Skp family chaperone for outer membrane proteins